MIDEEALRRAQHAARVEASTVYRGRRRRVVPGREARPAELVASSGELWVPFPPPSASASPRAEQGTVSRLRRRLPSFRVRDLTRSLVEAMVAGDG